MTEIRNPKAFFIKFEDVCGIASDGQGMKKQEMLPVLGQALEEHREKMYDGFMEDHRAGLSKTYPGAGYNMIKDKLMEFQESIMEHDTR